jgi:hypothetical protein
MARPKKLNLEEHLVDLSAVNLSELQAFKPIDLGTIEPVNGIGLYTVTIPKDKHERIQKIADFKKISVEKLIDLTLRELIAGRISI